MNDESKKALRSCGRGGQGHDHRISGRRPALCCTGRVLLRTEFLVRLHEQPVAAGRQGVPEETGSGSQGRSETGPAGRGQII